MMMQPACKRGITHDGITHDGTHDGITHLGSCLQAGCIIMACRKEHYFIPPTVASYPCKGCPPKTIHAHHRMPSRLPRQPTNKVSTPVPGHYATRSWPLLFLKHTRNDPASSGVACQMHKAMAPCKHTGIICNAMHRCARMCALHNYKPEPLPQALTSMKLN